MRTAPFSPASLYAVAHPDAFLRAVAFCPWKHCEVARLQDTPHGSVLTITLRGAPTVPLPIPDDAPERDFSRLPMMLLRFPRVAGRSLTAKRRRNFCYAWEEPMPDTTWTVVCNCGAGVITTREAQAAAERGRGSGRPGGWTFTQHS